MKQYLSRIFAGDYDGFLAELKAAMAREQRRFVVTANAEILMKAEQDETIHEMLLSGETDIVPDGISVVRAMNKVGHTTSGRITGVDLLTDLLKALGERRGSAYFYGAKEEVVRDLTRQQQEKYPEACYRCHNGYDGDSETVFREIAAMQPDLVAVGLGVPRQELLLWQHRGDFQKGILMGVGGSFDVLSGHVSRGPEIFIKTNTEWLFRILREPVRMKRFYENNIKFLWKLKD